MKRVAIVFFSIIMILFTGTSGFAAAPEWKVDQAHSGIYFDIRHIYSTVQGHFNEYEGTIAFDPANLKESRFDFKVKVKSVDTNNAKRDSHLQSPDFFEVEKYPEMTFKSTAITHAGGNDYTVEGTLGVKDVQQNIKLPFTFFGSKQHPMNPKLDVAGFEARLDIDPQAYHVGLDKFYQAGVIGKKVNILISIEATRDK